MRTLRRVAFAAALAAAALPIAACAGTAESAGAAWPRERGIVTVLRLGRSIRVPGQEKPGHVDDAALGKFLHEVVARHFPDGFTVVRSEGWWRPAGTTEVTAQEDSVCLEIVHCGTSAAEDGIRAVAREYAERFHQESVLRTDAPARVLW